MTASDADRERNLEIVTTPPHLGELVNGGDLELGQALGRLELDINDVDNFLGSFQRFNGTVHVHQEDGSVLVDDNYSLKRALEKVPGYLAGARSAGLSEAQVNELMLHMLDSNPYNFANDANEDVFWAYGEAFRLKAEKGEPIQPNEYQSIKELVGLSAKYGVMDSAAYAHLYATRIGLSVEQATQVIGKLPDADGHLSGYTFGSFNEALKSLIPAEVDANTVVQVFEAIGGERPYFNRGLYSAFEQIVIFGCQSECRTPQQLLEAIKYRLDRGDSGEEAVLAVAEPDNERTLATGSTKVEVVDMAQEIANYFIPKDGELEVLGLPYQTKRSLEDGVDDLRKIAKANLRDNLKIGEGMWVFDGESETWYSLGGKLEVTHGHVRNNFIPFDVSRLSERPLLFHVHPNAYSVMIAPMRGSGPQPEEFDDDVTDFLMATPSRADYDTAGHFVDRALVQHQSRAFIVHKHGITEYSYPHDSDQLAAMARDARSIRDETLITYDWASAMWQNPSREQVVEELVSDLAARIPKGFTLRMLDSVELSY